MASAAEQYVREIHAQLRYWATWAPSVHLELGDCGPSNDDWEFKPEANIRNFGVDFEPAPANPTTMPWKHVSDDSVSWDIQAKGKNSSIPNVPAGEAGISMKFSREKAIVFVALGGNVGRVANINQLKKDFAEAAGDRSIEHYWVVTELVTVDSASVLISTSSHGEFAATASANFTAGIVDLANASIGVSETHSKNVTTLLEPTNKATPLFNAIKLKQNIWHDERPVDAFVALTPSAYEAELPSVS